MFARYRIGAKMYRSALAVSKTSTLCRLVRNAQVVITKAVCGTAIRSPRTGGFDETDKFARLFLVPGMTHCSGGTRLDSFDTVSAIVAWIELSNAPTRMTATGAMDPGVSRPLVHFHRKRAIRAMAIQETRRIFGVVRRCRSRRCPSPRFCEEIEDHPRGVPSILRLVYKDDPRFQRNAPVQILDVLVDKPDATGSDEMADGLGRVCPVDD